MTRPHLAVVGCVNMGKSSLVSTLTECEDVHVAPQPGSTTDCQTFDLCFSNRKAFSLTDTPGFQNSRRALAWMENWQKENEQERATAVQSVKAFVEHFKSDASFVHECRLLAPILAGSGVLYVVNGAQPFHPRYEAEMRILSMTGAPRMGIINMRGDSSYADEWSEALSPYFKVFRFNALLAGMDERLRLLESFKGIHDDYAVYIDELLHNLSEEFQRRDEMAATEITALLLKVLCQVEKEQVKSAGEEHRVKQKLTEQLHNNFRKSEKQCREEIQKLYQHDQLKRVESDMPLWEKDLLDKESWEVLGLSKSQLLWFGSSAGAVVGGLIDLGSGGASFLMGTVIGGVVGAGASLFGAENLSKQRWLGQPLGGKVLQVEPPQGLQFPFVVLDRALLHWKHVRSRAHARRDTWKSPEGQDQQGVVSSLDQGLQKDLSQCFTKLRKQAGSAVDEDDRLKLIQLVKQCLLASKS